jgi:hypothetical protein
MRVGWGGGCTVHAHTPFTVSTIKYKDVVYTPSERANMLPLFLLYPFMYSVTLTTPTN